MMRTRLHWLLLLTACAVLGLFWINQSRFMPAGVSAETPAEAPIVGYQAPAFALTTFDDKPLTLNELKGQPILLNFWATWCGPCRAEMPALQTLAEQYAGRAHIVGINQGEAAAIVESFSAEFQLTYPLLLDQNSAINRRYTVRALPTTYFIDANGVIRDVLHGTASEAVLNAKLRALFDEP